jgi:hypothetical protein
VHTYNAFFAVFLAPDLLGGGRLVVFGKTRVKSVLDSIEAGGDDFFDLYRGVDVL